MTSADIKSQYLKSKGLQCPFCKSRELRADRPELNEDQCEVGVVCDTCEKEWTEFYTLTDVEFELN